MNLIVAVDKNWGIGKDNDLLYHVPEDMKYFRAKTIEKNVICGKKTLLSFPGSKPLPNRRHYVLTRSDMQDDENLVVVHSLEELEEKVAHLPGDDVLVIGGESVYRQLYRKCSLAFVTKIFSDEKEADVFFPNLDEDENFQLIDAGEVLTSKSGLQYAFQIYENKEMKKGS